MASTEAPRARADASPSDHPGPRSRRRARIDLVVGAVLGCLLAALSIAATTRLSAPDSPFGIGPQRSGQWLPVPTLLLIAGGLSAVALLGKRAGVRPTALALPLPLRWPLLLIAVLAVQLVIARAVLQNPPYDAAQVFSAAYAASVGAGADLFPASAQADYFAMYPNNALLVGFFAAVFGALRLLGLTGVQHFLLAALVLNCIAISASFALALLVTHRAAGARAVRVVAALGLPLVAVSPWLSVPYSDTLSMPFPIGGVALWMLWRDRTRGRRVVLWLLLGLLGAVGFAVKPTTVFAFVAVIAVELLSRPSAARRMRRATAVVALFAAAFAAGHFATGAVGAPVRASAVGSVPFSHFMAMGAGGDGGFDQADLDSTMAIPPAKRSASRLAVWEQRVGALGPVGYPVFLTEKVLYALSDGSFFHGREGVGPYSTRYLSSDPLSMRIQAAYPVWTPLHPALASVWQAAWWLIVLLCFVPGARGSGAASSVRPAARLALVLLIAFLCLSESRSRYLYHYLPLALVLAGIGSAALRQRIIALRDRRRAGRTTTVSSAR